MKKILLAFVLLFMLVSCSETAKADPFKAFDGDFIAYITSVCDGNTCKYRYESAEKRIEFLSPEELCGYSLCTDGESITLSYGDISVPVSEYVGHLILICESVFSVQAQEIVSILAESGEKGTETEVSTAECTYLFDSEGTPLSVTGYKNGISFKFEISSFDFGKK